MHFVAPSPLCL